MYEVCSQILCFSFERDMGSVLALMVRNAMNAATGQSVGVVLSRFVVGWSALDAIRFEPIPAKLNIDNQLHHYLSDKRQFQTVRVSRAIT